MKRAFKAALLVATSLFIASPLNAQWEIGHPRINELYSHTARNIAVVGSGVIGAKATIQIKYHMNGEWRVAYKTDVTVNEKEIWGHNCNAPKPIGTWPIVDGPNPTPYRVEVYEGKTLMASTDFRVVDAKRPKKSE